MDNPAVAVCVGEGPDVTAAEGSDVATAPAGGEFSGDGAAGDDGWEVGAGEEAAAGGWPQTCSKVMLAGAGALIGVPLPHFQACRSPFFAAWAAKPSAE